MHTVREKAKPYWHTRQRTGKIFGLKKFQYFFFVIFTTNADNLFPVSTCFLQLRLVSHSTSQYLHVQNKECEQFRFVSKQARFLCISHESDTYKLFIGLVTCVLIAKE